MAGATGAVAAAAVAAARAAWRSWCKPWARLSRSATWAVSSVMRCSARAAVSATCSSCVGFKAQRGRTRTLHRNAYILPHSGLTTLVLKCIKQLRETLPRPSRCLGHLQQLRRVQGFRVYNQGRSRVDAFSDKL